MADFLRKFNDYFGLTPDAGKDGYDDYREDGYAPADRDYGYERGYDRDYGRGYDEPGYDEPGYDEPGRDYDSPRLRPLAAPATPERVHITPRADFADAYSEAREIGERFRDGDVVTFDLVDLAPAERKRYLDFAAGLSFALRGRIIPDGTAFTLLPEGVELPDAGRDQMSV